MVNTSSNTTQFTVEKLNLSTTVKKILVSKVEMSWYFLKMYWQLVSHNVQMLHQSKKLLVNIFKKNVGFKKVLAFEFANNRKFMHLDTVFTMVDYDKFTIHPEIQGNLRVFSVTYENEQLKIVEEKGDLAELLAENLGVEKVTLIPCGDGNIVAAAREQWNDGSNTLTIAPGVVVVYDRNTVTNKKLEEYGLRLIKIRGSELVRGRGGPRCMSMPFEREEI